MVNAVPLPIILPVIFNDEFIVDAPETNKLVKFVLLNIDVDVLFKLLIDNVELVDKLFILLNIVVEVLFKLLIDNVELVDKLFKLLNIVVEVLFKLLIDNIDDVDKLFKFVFIPKTDKPDVVILPTTFNDDMHVEVLFKVVEPDIFNVEINVEGLLKLTNVGGFNIAL